MPKLQRNSVFITFAFLFMSFVLSSYSVTKKETLTFESADGLQVTADEYIIGKDNPYILLFHEQGSSRGEFETIARKLCKMDYNCLAVDMRNGGNDNFISNETVKRCQAIKCPTDLSGLEKDMLAAIEYAFGRSNQPVILFGSMANGSLSLKVATENNHVRAVVAFSPGEYFLPELSIQDTIAALKKPTFVTSSLSELPYVIQLVSAVEEDYLTIFEPKLGEGGRGSASLGTENENYSEYWLALLLFFKDLV
ncbi:MAG: dienelactone hydrolase family protein [Bacteroidota bacterium]